MTKNNNEKRFGGESIVDVEQIRTHISVGSANIAGIILSAMVQRKMNDMGEDLFTAGNISLAVMIGAANGLTRDELQILFTLALDKCEEAGVFTPEAYSQAKAKVAAMETLAAERPPVVNAEAAKAKLLKDLFSAFEDSRPPGRPLVRH